MSSSSDEMVTIDTKAKDKNQQLIAALIAGKSLSVSNNSDSLITSSTANNPLNLSSSDYTVTLVNGLLKFNSTTGLDNFLSAADIVVREWDPENDIELQGLPTEKNIAGDPALNNFDSTVGFSSLRKRYDMLAYDDPNFKDTIKTYIANPDQQTVLNINNEVQIGDTIYKYLSTYFLAKIYNSDYNLLQQFRNNGGKIIPNANIEYFNPVTNAKYSIPPVASGTTACNAFFVQPTITTDPQDNRRKTCSFTILTYDGTNITFGLISGLINWGDGSSTTLNLVPSWVPLSYQHTYNVNPAPGVCSTFTISLSGTVAASTANVCIGASVSPPSPTPINVCGVTLDCRSESHWIVTDPPLYFTYGGIEYRLTGQVGVDNSAGWFNRKIIYGRTYWAKKYGSGNEWYPATNKKARLGVEIYNKYYTSTCGTINNFYSQYWHFNRSNVTVKYASGAGNGDEENKIGWVPNITNGIKSNHYVRIVEKNGIAEFTYQNHYLH